MSFIKQFFKKAIKITGKWWEGKARKVLEGGRMYSNRRQQEECRH